MLKNCDNSPLGNFFFLLGGQDLEMLEIAKILDQNNITYLGEEKLKWGASYKHYDENPESLEEITRALTEGKKIIGIELDNFPQEDGFQLIDHHNENQDKPSAIKQVANLLGIKLDRYQQLVAANDKGYLKGMDAICATDKEKKEIRDADRKAQGISEKEEEIAKEDFESKKRLQDVTVVYTSLEKFSPIADLFFMQGGEKLIIYNQNELVYYGNDKHLIEEANKPLIDSGKTYSGGGKDGFFGLKKEAEFTVNEIESYKNEFVKAVSIDQFYSHHIFIFPFKWKNWRGEQDVSPFDVEHKLDDFQQKILKGEQWKRECYSLNSDDGRDLENYNEYNYFHAHVREILYDLGDDLKTNPSKENDGLMRHYQYKLNSAQNPTYVIKISNYEYQLSIDSILLNVYSTGVATLSFHLKNFKYAGKEHVFKINAFGRKLYPPFYYLDDRSIETGEANKKSASEGLHGLKHESKELPCQITLKGVNDETGQKIDLIEKFDRYECSKEFKHGPFLIPKFISGLFPENFLLTHEKKNPTGKQFDIYIRPVLDDRMFVTSWYGNSSFINCLNTWEDKINNYQFTTNQDWHKYVFVDGNSAMCQSKTMLPQLNKDHSYDRWVDWGTLYGMSRYSLVMLTGKYGDGVPSYLIRHLQTMYFKMAELCLIQRATVLSFSDEITHVTNLLKADNNKVAKEASIEAIKDLYKNYIIFLNKIYFKEITAQEQGIEMFNELQRHMDLKQDVERLDKQMEELYQFKLLEEQREQTQKSNQFAAIATLFLPATLVAGIFGFSNIKSFSLIEGMNSWQWLDVGIPVGLMAASSIGVWAWFRSKYGK